MCIRHRISRTYAKHVNIHNNSMESDMTKATTKKDQAVDAEQPVSKGNILQRIHAVMKEVTYIQKDSKAGMKYSVVSHDKVTAKIRSALIKHGIVTWMGEFNMKQEGNRTQLTCKVYFANIDDKHDAIVVDSAGYGIDTQDKGPGKAISYAFKYALLKTFCLETGDDPDLDQHVEYENAEDPHMIAIDGFKTDMDLAVTTEDLGEVLSKHRDAMTKAKAHYPGQAGEASAAYRMKLIQLRKEEEEADKK